MTGTPNIPMTPEDTPMTPEAQTPSEVITLAGTKALRLNIGVSVAGALLCLIFSAPLFTGFAAGTLLGLLNQRMCLRNIGRSFTLAPDKAMRFVMVQYYLRFIFVVATLGTLIAIGGVNPWGLIIGFSLVLLSTIVAVYNIARTENIAKSEGYA